jgi:hypothetical protein
MSDRSDSPEPSGWNSEATAKFYAAEAEKRRQEAESQKRLEELKKKNTDMQSLDPEGTNAKLTVNQNVFNFL